MLRWLGYLWLCPWILQGQIVSRQWEARLSNNKRDESRSDALVLWPWISKVKLYLKNRRPDCHGRKGTVIDRMLWCERSGNESTGRCAEWGTFDLDNWHWSLKVKLYLGNGTPDCHGTKWTGVDWMSWCETQQLCDPEVEDAVRDWGDLRFRHFRRLVLFFVSVALLQYTALQWRPHDNQDHRQRRELPSYARLHRGRMPHNNGNFRLTMPVVTGHCICDALPDTFIISVFKCGKISTTKKLSITNVRFLINSCHIHV